MAGLIRSEDVQEVKERSSLEDVVREHVTLRPAGTGSLKGLCPFHDERTPSFNVRPAVGAWHCFGCDEGGDVISFVMKVDHLSFTEAVERLAARVGMELRYEEGSGQGGRDREGGLGRRARLVEAHRVAAEYYHRALLESAEGRHGRDFLRGKGFDAAAAQQFEVGYSPRSGDALVHQLREKGFTDDELLTAGLAGRSSRGLYDRFRGRVMWPIRDITGDTVGFGARRLFDDDRVQAKYLNTSETPVYKKTSVLYGLDLAKKAMASTRRAVVVEGYTDVMACHLAGVENAVATCGTAFGPDHITTLRRILRDEAGGRPARVIFTFDGDEAGQKAAMRAFEQDQRWASQCFVAVAPAGQDPNELRQSAGDAAVLELIDSAVPMFEFAVRTTIRPFELSRAEERVQAMRAVAPIIAGIRDSSLRPEYTRTVAGWLGVDVEQLGQEVRRAASRPRAEHRQQGVRAGADAAGPPAGAGPEPAPLPPPDLRDPVVQAERQLLQVALQYPSMLPGEDVVAIAPQGLRAPVHRALWQAVRQAGAAGSNGSHRSWTESVAQHSPEPARRWVHELAVANLPVTLERETGRPPRRYVESLVVRVLETGLSQRIADAMSALRRCGAEDPEARRLSEELTALHRERARLRARTE
ncbi:DNA primase [Ornithinicoccus halotolerans]|uniref:DNA primase n=1 Tax=Ornithinicoccus halotolerans TaxID=1748220 RepID=UPI0012980180|nr:DNA primase [Ornithinicoccus halotolerans]